MQTVDEPSQDEYRAAFKRTGLIHTGHTLQTALANPMLKTCLTRIAFAQREKQAQKTKQYWFNNI